MFAVFSWQILCFKLEEKQSRVVEAAVCPQGPKVFPGQIISNELCVHAGNSSQLTTAVRYSTCISVDVDPLTLHHHFPLANKRCLTPMTSDFEEDHEEDAWNSCLV